VRSGVALVAAAAIVAGVAVGSATRVSAASPPGSTCPVLPADNVWNTDVSTLPVNSHSAAWLSSTGAGAGRLLHPDFGGPPYGIPFNVVTSAHATADFNFQYWDESDPAVATQQAQGPYPYGADLQVEAPTDSHLLTIVSDTCRLYETSGTDYAGAHTGWSGAIFDLGSNELRPDTWTSADAAGLPIFPGLVRLDEVQAGAIAHAIRFTVQQSDRSHLWPARHDAGSASNSNLPPMGARFRLKASFDISKFNAQAQVVLTAMKRYGLIVADNGSNWYFQGTTDSGWDSEPYATMVSQLKTVPAAAFEAVDESSLMIDPNSGQAAQPCAAATLSSTPASPQQRGAQLVLTAGSSTCAAPRYEFWVRYPNGSWVMKRSFSSSPSWSWDTSAYPAGTYTIHVWVNQAGSATTTWQSLAALDFTIDPSAPCTSAGLAPPTASQAAGSAIAFTASSSGCPYPRYEYWVRMLDGRWYMQRGFSSLPGWSWSTAALRPGTYLVHVWANQAGDQTAALETMASSTVTLTGCTSASLNPGSGSVRVGTAVKFTAGSGGCPDPVYEFWIQDTQGIWHRMTGFGGKTWTWNNAGWGRGTYHVHVWANQRGAFTGALEAVGSATFTLS
jgi:hypothetical protein